MADENIIELDAPKEKKWESRRSGDRWIWGLFLVICLISLVESYSASSQEVGKSGLFIPIIKHGLFLLSGIGVAYLLQHVHYNRLKVWIPIFAIVTLALVVYVMLHGDVINGARRSFRLPIVGFSVQPSEMAKLSVVTIIAFVMSKVQLPGGGVKWGGIVICGFIVLLFGACLYQQGFTNTVILMAISLSMMLISGVQWKRFFIVLLCYVASYGLYKEYKSYVDEKESAIVVQTVTTDAVAEGKTGTIDRTGTRKNRLDNFDLNEDSVLAHPMSSSFLQEQYGYMARANGGIFGVMPGNSRETSRLPLAYSDYVFSIIVEELGLVGGIILIVLYLALSCRAGSIAWRCKRAFPALLIMGMAVMISVQALSHMAINCGLVPVTGQPLPFISQGGSSIIVMSIAIGIMLSVSRYAEYKKDKEASTVVNDSDSNEAINPAQL